MHVRTLLPVLLSLLLVSCQSGPQSDDSGATTAGPSYQLENRADTLALQVLEEMGGAETWDALPYLRFTFAVEQGGERTPVAHHFWDRQNGDYRVEWTGQEGDTTFVALFNVNDHEAGTVYVDGEPVAEGRSGELLDQAYQRFINDTYWFLAPVKLLDPGVHLSTVPDSSTTEHTVVHASFDSVGLTPGDQYWYTIDRDSNRVDRWAYHLQSYEPDQPASRFEWTGYRQLDSPAGPAWVATRKESLGGETAILTDQVEAPESPPEGMFTDPSPRL